MGENPSCAASCSWTVLEWGVPIPGRLVTTRYFDAESSAWSTRYIVTCSSMYAIEMPGSRS